MFKRKHTGTTAEYLSCCERVWCDGWCQMSLQQAFILRAMLFASNISPSDKQQMSGVARKRLLRDATNSGAGSATTRD